MSKFASEKYTVIPLEFDSTTTTEVRSRGVSLVGVQRVSVMCGYNYGLNVLDSAAHPESSLAHTATFQVYVGAATKGSASFAALTSATAVLGMATVGELNGWESVQVQVIGTAATGVTLTLEHAGRAKTFTIQTNATLTDLQIGASNTTVFGNCLTSAINLYFPELEVVEGTTVGSGDTVAWSGIIKPKVEGLGAMNASVTAQSVSTVDVININGHRQVKFIDFTPAQVLATSTAYTQFCVGIDSSCTVTDKFAVAILETNHEAPTGVRIKPAG